ncbi:hypothetical protein TDB9533_04547 [Thalassocella blandensis]|nr:hypothetical protein TDB9533_04547 [Thalassocella blandensis]
MQLSQFKAVAKPRNAWQAIDLGFVIAKTAYWKLFFAGAIPAFLCFAFFSILFWDIPLLSAAITWWLKPVWERAQLYIISREIFADTVSLRHVARNYWHIIKTDLLWWLTLRRFSPTRSFDMPVTLLEQLKGKVRRKRLTVLHRRLSNGATWSLITGANIEAFLIFGFIAAFFMLVPQGVQFNWAEWFENRSNLVDYLYYIVWMVAMTLVAPFYVCAGFSLYLQRRIDLEGWDIEICFRDLVERRQKRNARLSSSATAITLLACLGISAALPPESFANTPDAETAKTETAQTINTDIQPMSYEALNSPAPTDEQADTATTDYHNPSVAAKQAREDIIAILKGEDYRDIQLEKGWRLKDPTEEKSPEGEDTIPEWLINFADWLDRHGSMFSWLADFFRSGAKLIELLLWLAVIGLTLFLILRFRHLIRRAFTMRTPQEEVEVIPPKVMFGLDVTEESLPENVLDSAKLSWQEGDHRQALGILLRSSIIKLLHEYKFPFHEGNTEKECAEIVEQQGKAEITSYFWPLTRQWQAVAYAHRECSAETFIHLCQSWEEVFHHAQ